MPNVFEQNLKSDFLLFFLIFRSFINIISNENYQLMLYRYIFYSLVHSILPYVMKLDLDQIFILLITLILKIKYIEISKQLFQTVLVFSLVSQS